MFSVRMATYSDGTKLKLYNRYELLMLPRQIVQHRVSYVRMPVREIISAHLPLAVAKLLNRCVLLVVRDRETMERVIQSADLLGVSDELYVSNHGELEDDQNVYKKRVCLMTTEHLFFELANQNACDKLNKFGAVMLDNVGDAVEYEDYRQSAIVTTLLHMAIREGDGSAIGELEAKLVFTTTSAQQFGSRVQIPKRAYTYDDQIRYINAERFAYADGVVDLSDAHAKLMGHLTKYEGVWKQCTEYALDNVIEKLADHISPGLDDYMDILDPIRNKYDEILGDKSGGQAFTKLQQIIGQLNQKHVREVAKRLSISWDEVLEEHAWMILSGREVVKGNVVLFASSERAAFDLYYRMARKASADVTGYETAIGNFTVILQDGRFTVPGFGSGFQEDAKYVIISFGYAEGWLRLPNVSLVLDTGVRTTMAADEHGVQVPVKRALSDQSKNERRRLLTTFGKYVQLYGGPPNTPATQGDVFDIAAACLLHVVLQNRHNVSTTKEGVRLFICQHALLAANEDEFEKAIALLEAYGMIRVAESVIFPTHGGSVAAVHAFVWSTPELNAKLMSIWLGVERPFEMIQSGLSSGPLFLGEREVDDTPANRSSTDSFQLRAREFCRLLTLRQTGAEGTERVAQHDILYSTLKVHIQEMAPELLEAFTDASGMHYSRITKTKEKLYRSGEAKRNASFLRYASNFSCEFNKAAVFGCLAGSTYFGLVEQVLEKEGSEGTKYFEYLVKTVAVNGRDGTPVTFFCTSAPLTQHDCMLDKGTLVVLSWIRKLDDGSYKAHLVSPVDLKCLAILAEVHTIVRRAMQSLFGETRANAIRNSYDLSKLGDVLQMALSDALEDCFEVRQPTLTLKMTPNHHDTFLPSLFRELHKDNVAIEELTLQQYCELMYSAANGVYVSGNTCIRCMARGHRDVECCESSTSALYARHAFVRQRFFTINTMLMNGNPSKMRMERNVLANRIICGGYANAFQVNIPWNADKPTHEQEYLNMCICGSFIASDYGHTSSTIRGLPLDHVQSEENAEKLRDYFSTVTSERECPFREWIDQICPSCYDRECSGDDYCLEKVCASQLQDESLARIGRRLAGALMPCEICRCADHGTESHQRVADYCRLRSVSLATNEETAAIRVTHAIESPESTLTPKAIDFTATRFEPQTVVERFDDERLGLEAFATVADYVSYKHPRDHFTVSY